MRLRIDRENVILKAVKVTVYRGENFVATNEFVLQKAAAQPLLAPVYVLVPDRFTLQAERFLLQQKPNLLNTRVVTFSMLYRLVSEEINFRQTPVEILDKTSAVLNLWTAIHKIQGQLTWFKNSAGHYDFAEKMFNTINQMRSSCVDFTILEAQAQTAVAKKKYHDINLIYQAYCQLIAPRTDSSGMLEFLTAHIAESTAMQNAEIFVCGFTSLSPARLQVLNTLCQTAQQVTIAASESELCAQLSAYKPYTIEVDTFAPKTVTVRNETERGEANIVIAKIVQLIADGVPPEDIVVLLTEFDTLAPVWQVVAEKYQLPVNLDVGDKLSTLPEAKYLRDLLEVLVNDNAENTLSLLYNSCNTIAEQDLFTLDNQIVAGDLRARMVPAIKTLKAVKDIPALCAQLKELTTNEKLQTILDQIATECREQPYNLREFIALFWTLCSATKVSNIPQYIDRVLIAPVNDWVPTRVQYLFIANCTAENFPQPQSDDDILQEADLVGTQITPTPSLQRERNFRHAELLRTVATKQIIFSGTHEDFTPVAYQPCVQFTWPDADFFQSPITQGRALFFPENRVNTTMVEKFYSCPYLNFIQNGLKLKPRPIHRLEANTVGSAIHEALQEYFTHGDLSKALAVARNKLAFDYPPLTKNIEKEIRFIIKRLTEIFANSKFNLGTQTEVCVKRDLKHGLTLMGRVDRVDVATTENGRAFLLLDYKTGHVAGSTAKQIYLGEKLQLPVYSSILAKQLGTDKDHHASIVGAGYLPLASGYAADEKEYTIKGFVNQELKDMIPPSLIKPKAHYYLDADLIAKICQKANDLVDEAIEKILAGCVAPQAVAEHVCDFCPVATMCPKYKLDCREARAENSSINFATFGEVAHE